MKGKHVVVALCFHSKTGYAFCGKIRKTSLSFNKSAQHDGNRRKVGGDCSPAEVLGAADKITLL